MGPLPPPGYGEVEKTESLLTLSMLVLLLLLFVLLLLLRLLCTRSRIRGYTRISVTQRAIIIFIHVQFMLFLYVDIHIELLYRGFWLESTITAALRRSNATLGNGLL